MEQNGNNGSQSNRLDGLLKKLADQRREQERAFEEARRLGLPMPTFTQTSISDPTESQQESQVNRPLETVEAEDAILTSVEAAKLLGYTPKSFRNAVSSGKIPHYKLFGQNRFRKSELLGLLVKVETT